MSAQKSQEYRGNGHHEWEPVTSLMHELGVHQTLRLRVPGGWLYQSSIYMNLPQTEEHFTCDTVFVPMPAVVKHAV